jgi:hypothetical protein
MRSRRLAPWPRLPSLFGLAPCGVYPAAVITAGAVRSYRTFSPLPGTGRPGISPSGRRSAPNPGSRSRILVCPIQNAYFAFWVGNHEPNRARFTTNLGAPSKTRTLRFGWESTNPNRARFTTNLGAPSKTRTLRFGWESTNLGAPGPSLLGTREKLSPAVCFLWHLPSMSLDAHVPDVIRHTALWSSDFPLPADALARLARQRPPGPPASP